MSPETRRKSLFGKFKSLQIEELRKVNEDSNTMEGSGAGAAGSGSEFLESSDSERKG